MLERTILWRGVAATVALVLIATTGWGQRVRLPQSSPPTTTVYQGQGAGAPNSMVPVPSLATPPGTTLGAPSFDPYSTAPGAAATAPSLLGQPSPSYGGATSPYWQTPPAPATTASPYASPYPAAGMSQQPPVLFPNGLNLPQTGLSGAAAWPGWPQAQPGPYLRLFQDLRFTYTWLYGGSSSNEMSENDIEVGTTVNFPNFFWSGRPLHVSPIFILNLWNGPVTSPTFRTELPARVYSAYGNFRWQPMITPMFGGDLDVNIGVFSDFKTVTNDSVRVFGTGLFVLALTPTVTLKGGVNYLDRVDLKLLPAAGILWTPNPQTRFDIYFPKPKLSQFLTSVGNSDVWWYINGEYGGGSWTVDRSAGAIKDPGSLPMTGAPGMDINDIRVGGGLEWTGQKGVRGFVEAAYVFNRELVFVGGPISSQSLKDTFMLRGGLAY